MALDTLRDMSVQFSMAGLLLVCLLGFAISFMVANNPIGLDDGTGDVFTSSYGDTSSLVLESGDTSNEFLNITSNTNPEVSDLGSRDSVSTGFLAKGSATDYWTASMNLMGWVFSGFIGKMLLASIGSLVGMLAGFLIWQYIRTGR